MTSNNSQGKKNVTRIGQFKITDTQNQIVFLYGGQKKKKSQTENF